MGRTTLVAAITSFIMAAGGAWAADAAVELKPGKTLEFDIEGTPPSLADLKRVTHAKSVRMTVKLPDTYEAGRAFPVLVFLSGGDGGNGGELHQAEPFLGGTDFILCNMPIFKQDLEGDTDDRKLSVTPQDGPYALPAFRRLFDELHRRIPNIDDARSVIGGFSNGANSVGLLLWAGDKSLLDRFSTFVLVEGGFWLAADHMEDWPDIRFKPATLAGLENKRVLIMYGDQTEPPDRVPWIKNARASVEALRKAGVKTAVVPMMGVGHDFPREEMIRARAWVLSGL